MLEERLPVVAADGHRYAVEIHESPSAAAAILVLPAMGVTTTYYAPLVKQLVAAGLTAAVTDWRGHGQSDTRARRGVDWGYRELAEVDLPATLEAVRNRLPRVPIYALGHSLGGQIGCLHAAANPGELAGVALMASCSVYYRGWGMPGGLAMLGFTQMVGAVAAVLGYFPGNRLRFAGVEGRRQMLDWARNARTGRWEIEGSAHDYETLLGKVEVPVIAMSIEGDTYAPALAVDNQVAKLARAPVTRHHWTAADLDRAGMHHMRWVRHSEPVVAKIVDWISK